MDSGKEPASLAALAADVCKASMRGDQAALLQALDTNPELINHPDDQGHFPLHWAALNNRTSEVALLIERGAKVRAANPDGATALHWAVFRNALPCMEALLRAGADKDAKDTNGYQMSLDVLLFPYCTEVSREERNSAWKQGATRLQACHIAAQWGHTAALFHLVLRWDASFDTQDKDGRTPLHWAAYKGFHDCVRLLLVLGCSPHDIDIEGCNVLHWAALRGNSEAATITLQARFLGGGLTLLTAADRLGNTPEQCAANSGHRMLAHFLHNQELKLKREAMQTSKIWLAIRKLQFAPVIWIAAFVSAASFYWKVVHSTASFAEPLPWMSYMAMLSILLTGWGVLLMAVLNVSDPGYVPRRGSGQHRGGEGSSLKALSSVENLDCPAMWAGRWEQLCVTCKIVRPLRAKHEENAGRCIEVGSALWHIACRGAHLLEDPSCETHSLAAVRSPCQQQG